MKKIIALILAILMCVSIASCGGTPEKTDDGVSTESPVETPTEAPTEGSTEAHTEGCNESREETEPESEEASASAPTFDSGWADGGYEMPIPEPPFAYEINTRSNGVKITSLNGGVDGDVTHSNILAYCGTLKAIGFDIDVSENVIGERYGRTCYEFRAANADGNSVELVDDGGGVAIFVYFDVNAPTEESTQEAEGEDEPAFDTSWASNEFEALLPQLPLEGWKTSKKSDSEYKMELGGLKDSVITDDDGNMIGYGEDKQALIYYLESLKGYGFSVTETGGIEGYEYEWLVVDPAGNEIEFTCAEGYCWITITKE